MKLFVVPVRNVSRDTDDIGDDIEVRINPLQITMVGRDVNSDWTSIYLSDGVAIESTLSIRRA